MKKIYLILPILAGLMFGSSGIFVRTLTQNGIDPITLLFLRFSIAIIPILLAITITDKNLLKITKKDIPLFLICALCIVGLNLCYNTSMNSVSLSLAAVLLSLAPIYVLIFAYILFREKITLKKVICMILAIFGCILMTGVLESNLTIAFLIIHSTFSFALPYIFSTISLNYIDSGTSSILLSGAEPLAALIFGLIIYFEVPTAAMFSGFILSLISMMMLTRLDTKQIEM